MNNWGWTWWEGAGQINRASYLGELDVKDGKGDKISLKTGDMYVYLSHT